MSDLHKIFNPRSIAVIGASDREGSVGRTLMKNLSARAAKTVPNILEQCGKAGIAGVIVISAGFKEVGAEGSALEDRILKIEKKYNLRIVGPNCLGTIRPSIDLNATFHATLPPKAGSIAFISQSGAVGAAILDWAAKANIGFSNFVSIGSMIDVDFGDLIDY